MYRLINIPPLLHCYQSPFIASSGYVCVPNTLRDAVNPPPSLHNFREGHGHGWPNLVRVKTTIVKRSATTVRSKRSQDCLRRTTSQEFLLCREYSTAECVFGVNLSEQGNAHVSHNNSDVMRGVVQWQLHDRCRLWK